MKIKFGFRKYPNLGEGVLSMCCLFQKQAGQKDMNLAHACDASEAASHLWGWVCRAEGGGTFSGKV